MSIIDRVIKRFEEVGSDPVAVVPEWSDEQGKPTVVYADPWTVADHERFTKLHGREKDWAADVVIAKAKDVDGNPLFDKVDVLRLSSKGERHVVMRVAEAIMYSMTLDAAKNGSALATEETPSPGQ